MRDFTLNQYRQLLLTLQQAGYCFITMEQYCRESHPQHFVILRHDVDKRPFYSLRTAQLEHELGIHASYYFRVVPQSWNVEVIEAIRDLGHEIGYHYEDMSLVHGDTTRAVTLFEQHLAQLRAYYPVTTICMHGAPTSAYDGRDLWKTYDYHTYGIVGEPYFDVNFDHTLYLTDTGRRWDGYRVSVRDKVPQQQEWNRQGLTFHHTSEIVRYMESKPLSKVPSMMITTHPQRWTNALGPWLQELILQTFKNTIKRFYVQKNLK